MSFSSKLLAWYKRHKRDLPWRNTTDPYKIWISEIILQQTRVEQGMPYYNRFVQKYPTLKHLALAKEGEILKQWQGLGYYSRARNLHFAAKSVLSNHKGVFPKGHSEIKKLKGVGDYTAAAIASIAFGKAHAAVDGNVMRVLSRLFLIGDDANSAKGKKKFQKVADDVLDKKNPAAFNQAMMELGALVCKPQNPLCDECPVNMHCLAFEKNLQQKLPVKKKKIQVRNRYFNYIVILRNQKTALEKRTGNDIWKNMYHFPLTEANHTFSESEFKKELKKKFPALKYTFEKASPLYKHQLSHQTIYAKFFIIHAENNFLQKNDAGLKFFSAKQLEKIALPRLVHKFMQENNLLQ